MTNAAFEARQRKARAIGEKAIRQSPQLCRRHPAPAGRLYYQRTASLLFVFNIQDIQGKDLSTHQEAYEFLEDCGVAVIAHRFVCKTSEEVWRAIEAIGDMRGTFYLMILTVPWSRSTNSLYGRS